ncbi:DNA cytosine methyltransferase [Fervidicoccus sp.]|uniref:DNA cytosine methyltransferase n=1 Tax=Fervidicoccus sp. TaxID=2060324 RepID=UPI003D10A044
MNPKEITVVDLFCGGGGFSRGFHDVGFKVKIAIDNEKNVARTYKYNFLETIVIAEDIKEVSGKDILDALGRAPDIVIGSPPCEPYTAANKKRMNKPLDRLYSDPMGILTLSFFRIVGELKPSIWIMENVPAILEDGLKDALEKEAERSGYKEIYFNILKAEEYCTPSKRTRIFVSNIEIKPEKCNKKVTVAEALEGLPSPNPNFPPNHDLTNLSFKKERKVSKISPGEALIRYEGHGGRVLPNMIRLEGNRIAPTVLGSSRFLHPEENRLITVREQARLMGYPDEHVFLGGKDEQYNMIGESVPPTLSKAIAAFLIKNF